MAFVPQERRQQQHQAFGGGDDAAADDFDVDDQEGEGMEGLQLGNSFFRDGEYDTVNELPAKGGPVVIEAARHPVLEGTFSNESMPKETLLAEVTNLLLFSGPKMSGESTYLRQAIKAFSQVLQAQPADPAIILSNRCASFCRLSEQLRKIPAETSEENALFGLDPMSLVQVALKDAEKLLKLRPNWPKAYLRKGTSLLLLEQYELAKDTFLDGLQLDPASKALQAALRDLSAEFGERLDEIEQTKRLKRSTVQRSDDLDCTLCLKLLYNPITTPCGHSFCRACLLQAMDHGNKCPMCRTVLFVSPRTYPVSVTLNNLIQRNFVEEYKERKVEMDEVTLGGNEILPLFVMNVFLPYEKMQLNIFEPRYRLMVRRIMEGNHRMGMVGIDADGALADVGCEVEICECQPLADGRFYLEVEGRRRCKIMRAWEQDGYRVAQVQWLQDVAPPQGSPEYEQTSALVQDASKLAEAYISQARNVARTDRRARFSDLISRAEGMPDGSNPEAFSFWFANLLNMRSAERKLQLLRLTDTRERLVQEMDLLRDGPQGCNIQ